MSIWLCGCVAVGVCAQQRQARQCSAAEHRLQEKLQAGADASRAGSDVQSSRARHLALSAMLLGPLTPSTMASGGSVCTHKVTNLAKSQAVSLEDSARESGSFPAVSASCTQADSQPSLGC